MSAPVKWAQRKDALFIEIAVADIDKDARIVLTATKLEFQGKSHGKEYTADLEFFAEVDPNDAASKFDIKARAVLFHVVKKDKESSFWPRLLKDKMKEKNQIQIDWSKYVDEDEADEKGGFDQSMFGPGAMNFGGGGDEGDMGMGGFGGGMGGLGGGMGGMDMESLMAKYGGAGGLSGLGGPEGATGDGADEDDDLPDLEADDASKAQ